MSIEFVSANAEIARAIWKHAGITDRARCVVGTLGDGGTTADALAAEHGFGPGSVDACSSTTTRRPTCRTTKLMLDRGWLHAGSVLVADNIKFPGAPDYRAFMTDEEGRTFRTVEHETHAEYQTLIKDLVLESEYLGGPGG